MLTMTLHLLFNTALRFALALKNCSAHVIKIHVLVADEVLINRIEQLFVYIKTLVHFNRGRGFICYSK